MKIRDFHPAVIAERIKTKPKLAKQVAKEAFFFFFAAPVGIVSVLAALEAYNVI